MELSARFLTFTTYGVQWVLWLLIGLSVISVAMILERFWCFATYRPEPQTLVDQIRALLASVAPRAMESEREGIKTLEVLEAAVEGAKARERLSLERNLAFLGTLGSNAPFIGLFGTVLGIIKAFHDLAGNQAGGPAVVMAGISEALVATAVGLMVAIPAVVAFNYFNRRVRTSMTQVDWMAQLAFAELKAETAAASTPSTVGARLHPGERVSAPTSRRRLLLWVTVFSGVLLLLGLSAVLTKKPSRPARLESAAEPVPTPRWEPKVRIIPPEVEVPEAPAVPGADPALAPAKAEEAAVAPPGKKPPKGKKRKAPAATTAPAGSPESGSKDAPKSSPASEKDAAPAAGGS